MTDHYDDDPAYVPEDDWEPLWGGDDEGYGGFVDDRDDERGGCLSVSVALMLLVFGCVTALASG